MKKIIVLLVLILSSCSLQNNYDENIKNSKNVKKCDWNNPYEQCEIENILDTDIDKKQEIEKINWSDDIEFSYCDNKYSETSEYWNRRYFFDKEEVILLTKKMKEYNKQSNDKVLPYENEGFPYFISEYCKTLDGAKYQPEYYNLPLSWKI